jgi:hypothetical protein
VSPILFGTANSQPRFSTPGLAYRAPLLNGEPGTAQTIALMRRLVDEALADPQFVRQAIEIVRAVPAYDDFAEAEALYRWVKRHIRFTKDPVTKEKLYPPQELLKIGAGDCDDIAMLLGAFLMAIGYNARLVTVSANRENPTDFSHVYVEGEVPPGSGNWIPMDAAHIDSEFGTEPPTYFRKRAWSLSDDSYQDLSMGRLPGSLSGYARKLLSDGSDEWSQIISQGLTEIPAIMSTAAGGSSSVSTPGGQVVTAPANPYASFATPYTPGYGVPPAGYGTPVASTPGVLTSVWPWLLAGIGAYFLLRGHR